MVVEVVKGGGGGEKERKKKRKEEEGRKVERKKSKNCVLFWGTIPTLVSGWKAYFVYKNFLCFRTLIWWQVVPSRGLCKYAFLTGKKDGGSLPVITLDLCLR